MPRSKPRVAIATFQPSPTGPSTLSLAVRASSKKTSLNSALPVIWRSGRTSMPGWSIGHKEIREAVVRRSTRDRCGTRTKHQSARCASVVHTFWPVITHSSPSSTARVWMFARSEPAFGSEKPWHHSSSTDWIFGRNRRFCSSVPNWISVGANSPSPKKRDPRRRVRRRVLLVEDHLLGERAASRPPYSFGHDIPTHRSAPSTRSHSIRASQPVSSAGPPADPERRELAGEVLGHPRPHLGAKRRLIRGVTEVHAGRTLLDRPVSFLGAGLLAGRARLLSMRRPARCASGRSPAPPVRCAHGPRAA